MFKDEEAHLGLSRHNERIKITESRVSDIETHQNSLMVDLQKVQSEFEFTKQDFVRLRKKQMDLEHEINELKTLVIQIKFIIIGAIVMTVVSKIGLTQFIIKIMGL